MTSLQFGWASASSNMETGIIAVGFGVEIAGYYCMVDQMYLQGIINSRAFSMDLGGVDSTAGRENLYFILKLIDISQGRLYLVELTQ